ncbi:MAG: S8 family serine peptidase, partial [Acidobacteria bacterium]|nr:S8 family serine peptidase [Acidobacteriota bacterium]
LLSIAFAAAAAAPFVTHGARAADDAPTFASRGASSKSDAGGGAEFGPGRVLVRFRDEAAASAVETVPSRGADGSVGGRALVLDAADGAQIGARVERFAGSDIVPGLRLAYVAEAQTLAAIGAFKSRPDVLYAEPDFVRHLLLTPNDPRFASGELYGLQKINAPTAWNTTQGSNGVVVGVIDEGIDTSHQDLAANVWTNPGEIPNNGVDDDHDGYVDDVNGWDFVHNDRTVFDSATGDDHATHVAGTIGAVGNNGVGVVGVNWHVSLMSLKVLDGRTGAGGGGGTSDELVSAYSYALMMRQRGVNLRALNNSYGGGGSSQAELDAIRALSDAGILFVAAAGNGGGDGVGDDNFRLLEFPADYDSPNVIAVAATDSNDSLTTFSNFSSRLVSIGAPGSGILSTTPNNTYSFFSGTSMATPHVTGAAALLCAANPNISLSQLRGALAYTGDVLPALQGKTTTGRRLNVANAVAAALENDTTPPAPAANLNVASLSGRSVTVEWNAPGDDGNSGQASDYDFDFVDAATGVRTALHTPSLLLPAAPGTRQSATVDVPFRATLGAVELRTYDDEGNSSTASVAVSVPRSIASDPYVVTESAPQPLSTGGTRLALDGDDKYLTNYFIGLQGFQFPGGGSSLTISTNGALYFTDFFVHPQTRDNGDADDVPSSVAGLQRLPMIAPLWDDLMIDTTLRPDSGVFVVQPDSTRRIFRWQGVTFLTHAPVNFEVELQSNGTIIFRYGDNPQVFPVVGVSAGDPSAYVVDSHTHEFGNGASQPVSLSFAGTVTFTPRSVAQGVVFFPQTNGSYGEALRGASILLARNGNTQVAASVEVRTLDDSSPIPCNDTTTKPNVAFARCDYVTTVQTVTFAPGETNKTVVIPLVDDGYAEPTETFHVILTNPSDNAVVGSPSTFTAEILDNDGALTPNPYFNTDFFVRQQYLDFLLREPDADGFNSWRGLINGCAEPFNSNVSPYDPVTNPSALCDRINVSANFFLSTEFQLKGGYVFRFYKLTFARLPHYTEFTADSASVTGATSAEVFAKKAAFADAWVQRAEFTSQYNVLNNTDFVNTLMGRYGLQSITTPDPLNPDGSTKIPLTRADLINRLTAATLTRAQVVRAIADSDQVGGAEFNSAFVSMQYFGYLRRDPDPSGYDTWTGFLASHPGQFRNMVFAFIASPEYKSRFGNP